MLACSSSEMPSCSWVGSASAYCGHPQGSLPQVHPTDPGPICCMLNCTGFSFAKVVWSACSVLKTAVRCNSPRKDFVFFKPGRAGRIFFLTLCPQILSPEEIYSAYFQNLGGLSHGKIFSDAGVATKKKVWSKTHCLTDLGPGILIQIECRTSIFSLNILGIAYGVTRKIVSTQLRNIALDVCCFCGPITWKFEDLRQYLQQFGKIGAYVVSTCLAPVVSRSGVCWKFVKELTGPWSLEFYPDNYCPYGPKIGSGDFFVYDVRLGVVFFFGNKYLFRKKNWIKLVPRNLSEINLNIISCRLFLFLVLFFLLFLILLLFLLNYYYYIFY